MKTRLSPQRATEIGRELAVYERRHHVEDSTGQWRDFLDAWQLLLF